MTDYSGTIMGGDTSYFLDDWTVRSQEVRKSDGALLDSRSTTPASTGAYTLSSPDIYDRRIKLIAEQPLGTDWQASEAVSVGDYRKPTTFNGYTFRCTTAGTTGSTEPAWNQTHGATTTDGTVEWTCVEYIGQAASQGKFWQGEYEAAAGTASILDPSHANSVFRYPIAGFDLPATRRLSMTDVDFVDGVASFNGTSGSILLQSAPALTAFTFAFKFTADTASTGGSVRQVFAWRGENCIFSWDHTAAAFQLAAALRNSSTWYTAQLTSTPASGTQHSIVITYDGTDLKIYFNKTLEATTNIGLTPNTTQTGARVGSSIGASNSAASYFDGDVEVFIVHDAAWTQAQVDAFVDYG